jgi:hypothetical protein
LGGGGVTQNTVPYIPVLLVSKFVSNTGKTPTTQTKQWEVDKGLKGIKSSIYAA